MVHHIMKLSDAFCPPDASTGHKPAQGTKLMLFLKCAARRPDTVALVGQSRSCVSIHVIFGVIGDSVVVTAHLADRFAVLQLLKHVKSL